MNRRRAVFRWRVGAASITLLAAMALSYAGWSQDSPPAEAYIEGVPFVGYHEMRDAVFPGSDVLNPSYTAAAQMMYGYWGADFVMLARTRTKPAGWTISSGENAATADLKALLARGIPVAVAPATTTTAQRLYLTPKMCAMLKGLHYESPRPASGALGEMISLEAVQQLRDGDCGTGLNDSVVLATRLLVGFDDARQIFVMHDPSLGPDVELDYDAFDRSWQATEAKYWAAHPDPISVQPAGRTPAVRPRTPDDDAAVALFHAYGLEIGGRYTEAEPLLRAALGLDGLGAGRRYLLDLELAVTLNATGRCTEAIEAARRANETFGDYALGHALLANLLACSDDRSANSEAKREQSRAKSLCNAKAQRTVADELGRDFHVMGCNGEMLGWFRP